MINLELKVLPWFFHLGSQSSSSAEGKDFKWSKFSASSSLCVISTDCLVSFPMLELLELRPDSLTWTKAWAWPTKLQSNAWNMNQVRLRSSKTQHTHKRNQNLLFKLCGLTSLTISEHLRIHLVPYLLPFIQSAPIFPWVHPYTLTGAAVPALIYLHDVTIALNGWKCKATRHCIVSLFYRGSKTSKKPVLNSKLNWTYNSMQTAVVFGTNSPAKVPWAPSHMIKKNQRCTRDLSWKSYNM